MNETKLRINWENKKSAQKLVFPLYIVTDIKNLRYNIKIRW
jgi:hypothetical protein